MEGLCFDSLGVPLRVGLSAPIFLLVPHKKDFHYNP